MNNGIVFADELTQIAMSSTPATNLTKLRNITQLANNNLQAPGGVLLHPKMQLSKSVIEN